MSTLVGAPQYPQVSEAQEIGNLAVRCFHANHPLTWHTDSGNSDNDFGFDFSVQVKQNNQIKWSFKVQLKGTKSPDLNAAGDLFSISLSASTVRYYANTTEPILLVLADISVDPTHPKNCPLYYVWIHDGLKRFNEAEGEGLPDTQKYVAFQIPKNNLLTEDTDLSGSIDDQVRISKVGEFLHTVIERHHPHLDSASKISLAENIPHALNKRGAEFINAVVEDSHTLWPEPKTGTLRWDITESLRLLKSGHVTDSEELLNKAKGHAEQPEAIEKAEMLYIEGRIHSFRAEDQKALECHAKAHELVPEVQKYIASWAETELRIRYSPDETHIDFSDVIAKLNGSDPLILNVKVKAIAAERKFDDAIAVANTMEERDKWGALATVFVMMSKFDEAITACNEGLKFNSLNDHQKILLVVMRARAKFYLATNYISWKDKDAIYPISGSADTNIPLLKEAWEDTEYLIEQFRQLNWPPNTNFISDLWASIASVLNKQKETLFLLKEAAQARPSEDLQQALELIAGQTSDFTTALSANAHLRKSSSQILRRLHLLHLAKKDSEFIALLSQELPSLDRTLDLFGAVLVMGILSAKRIIQFDIARQWEEILASTPEIEDDYAVYRFFDSINSNRVTKENALEDLEKDYLRLDQSLFIGIHLFHELDSTVSIHAEKIVNLASRLERERRFSLDSLVHLAQALTTLRRWEDLLALTQRALEQYENHERFIGIRAIALDRLGRSAEAATSLKALIDAGVDEPFALQTYLNIVIRSGFTTEAIGLLETVLGQESDEKRKFQYLQFFFNLVYFSNPESPRCLDILFQIAPLVNQSKEDEEGSFLVKYFMASQVSTQDIGAEKAAEIGMRFENFFKNFPNSNILKQASIPKEGDAESIMAAIEKLVGNPVDQKQFYTKVVNQLRTGTVPFPFALRPDNILQNVRDLPHLWERCKRSSVLEKQYHLTMVGGDFTPTEAAKVDGKIPLIDLTALLVLQDLDLLDHLFGFFPKIAIGQATLSNLNELIRPISGSIYAKRCSDLQEKLKKHFASIEQPYVEIPQDDSFMTRNWEVGEVKELALAEKYVLYSDDFLFRIYCQIPEGHPTPICTLDFLAVLEEKGVLSEREVAHKIALLCAWKVSIILPNRHAIAAFPEEVKSAHSVKQCLGILEASSDFSAIYNAIWDMGLPHQTLLGNLGGMGGLILSESAYKSYVLAAFLIVWSNKSALRTDIRITLPTALIQSVLQIAFANPDLSDLQLKQLISAYSEAIEFIHGEHMDERLHLDSLKSLAGAAANEDIRLSQQDEKSLGNRLALGFTKGTSESDAFGNAYTQKYVELTASRTK